MKKNIAKEYFKKIFQQNKLPFIWINDLYILLKDKLLDELSNNNFYKEFFQVDMIKKIVNKLKKYELDKKEIHELATLEWVSYLCPNVKNDISKAIKNNDFFSYSEKDEKMPDFKIGSEYYEITSKVDVLDKNKYKTEKDYESAMMDKSWELSKTKCNKNLKLFFGNKHAKKHILIEGIGFYAYKRAFHEIVKKLKNKYNIENQKINIIVWFDRNNVNGIFAHHVGLLYFIMCNFNDNINERKEYFDKIFNKIKNIYFIGENRITIDKLRKNDPKYASICINFNKEHLK